MGKRLDICYALAKENMVFRKYPAIHELEMRRGVEEACQLTVWIKELRKGHHLTSMDGILGDDDSDIHVHTECESSSTESSELINTTIISDFLI